MKKSLEVSAAALQKATSRLFKTPTLEELTKHKNIEEKNLYEMLAIFPNQGIGFKVWRRQWTPDHFIVINQAKYKGLRTGKFFGIEHRYGKALTEAPVFIRNGNKRGIWRYDTNNVSFDTQNGLHYSADTIKVVADMHRAYKV